MRFNKIIIGVALAFIFNTVNAQNVQLLESGKRVSFRGLSVVNDKVLWASGSNGSVVRSIDGGKTMEWIAVPGYEKRDFRDIEAFDENTAVIMGIAEPAIILKTKDGGKTWKKVFEDSTKGMFLDAMDVFIDEGNSHSAATKDKHMMVVVGDPIDGKLFHAMSPNSGDTWRPLTKEELNKKTTSTEGEAFFASSGTNVKFIDSKDFDSPLYAVSGGTKSQLWDIFYWKSYPLPIMQGKESTGANSLAISPDQKKGIVVGGDFTKDSIATDNCVLISFEKQGPVFSIPQTSTHGYRSCVIYLNNNHLVACGTSGIDVSTDGGKNWQLISKESFHVVQKARNGKSVFLAGGNGRIAQLIFPSSK